MIATSPELDDTERFSWSLRPSRPSGCYGGAVKVIRTTLFEAETLQLGLVDTRPAFDACGDIEWQSSNVVVLPFAGVFSKHDAPGREATG